MALDRIVKHRNGGNVMDIISIFHDQRKFSGGLVPLEDAGHAVIGDMIVLKDITAEAGLLRALLISMSAFGLIGIGLILFFYFFVDRIEKRLIRSHQELASEINDRKQIQSDLQQAHDHMESRVNAATSELTQMNLQLQKRVSECELTKEELSESEKKYSTLVEDALTGVYIVSDGKVEFANEKFADIFGYSCSELLGMESLELIYPEDRPRVEELRERRINRKSVPSVYEVRGITKSGAIVWLLRSNTLIQSRGKQLSQGVYLTLRSEGWLNQNCVNLKKNIAFFRASCFPSRKMNANELLEMSMTALDSHSVPSNSALNMPSANLETWQKRRI